MRRERLGGRIERCSFVGSSSRACCRHLRRQHADHPQLRQGRRSFQPGAALDPTAAETHSTATNRKVANMISSDCLNSLKSPYSAKSAASAFST
jgi:hypothetical protein